MKFKTIITNVMTLLNEDVFGTIYDFLQIHSEKRNTLNCAFPFPPNIRIGLLKECLVIEYCSPEEVDSDILYHSRCRIIHNMELKIF